MQSVYIPVSMHQSGSVRITSAPLFHWFFTSVAWPYRVFSIEPGRRGGYSFLQAALVHGHEFTVVGILHRFREIVALNDIAAHLAHFPEGVGVLHALLGDLGADLMHHVDNTLQKQSVPIRMGTGLEHLLVDLDLIKVKGLEHREGGIARAKVVQRAAEACGVKLLDHTGEVLIVLIGKALGKLDGDEFILDIKLLLDALIVVQEVRLDSRDPGHVDGNGYTGWPFWAISDAFSQAL